MPDWISLARLDGVAQAELCAKGEVTANELREAALRRIDALNPLLHAVVTVAREKTATTAQGPFAGVPFLMKDASPWPGLRWSMGSRLFAGNIAPAHTPYTAKLEASGLTCVGKSATSEFGLLGSTETLAEGITHNPWDLSMSATGSSGGSAAAVAAGLVPLAHANDGGGSIRIPASVHGLFGFKPSKGRTLPAAFASSEFLEITSDHCISRSVRDSALFLSLTEDPSRTDPVGFVQRTKMRRLKIVAYTRTAMGEEAEPEIKRAFDDAVSLVTSLGHEVVVAEGPALDGQALSDAFFLVAGAAIAGVVEMMDKMRGMPVQEAELEPFTWSLVEPATLAGAGGLQRAKEAFRAAVRAYHEATAGYDLVMTPTLATSPWRLGHLSPTLPRDELIARTARAVGYTPLQNISGCPAMSVPLTFPRGEVPLGTHFAAAAGNDALLLGLAYELEEARPWRDQWAPYSIPKLF
ncbi:MAG: amidase family protein [Polyangiaceae bacterium]